MSPFNFPRWYIGYLHTVSLFCPVLVLPLLGSNTMRYFDCFNSHLTLASPFLRCVLTAIRDKLTMSSSFESG